MMYLEICFTITHGKREVNVGMNGTRLAIN